MTGPGSYSNRTTTPAPKSRERQLFLKYKIIKVDKLHAKHYLCLVGLTAIVRLTENPVSNTPPGNGLTFLRLRYRLTDQSSNPPMTDFNSNDIPGNPPRRSARHQCRDHVNPKNNQHRSRKVSLPGDFLCLFTRVVRISSTYTYSEIKKKTKKNLTLSETTTKVCVFL